MRQPGIEPGSTAWKAAVLTTIPPTRRLFSGLNHNTNLLFMFFRQWKLHNHADLLSIIVQLNISLLTPL